MAISNKREKPGSKEKLQTGNNTYPTGKQLKKGSKLQCLGCKGKNPNCRGCNGKGYIIV